MAASDIASLLGAFVDELAHECLLPDTARHSVGAGQRDGRASDIPSRRGETDYSSECSPRFGLFCVALHVPLVQSNS